MRHSQVEEWSRRPNFLSRRDARVKLAMLLAVLVATAFAPPALCAAYALAILSAAAVALLPLGSFVLRAAVVLPFSFTFAALTYWSGDPRRAVLLLERSYTSSLAVLLVVATTPMPALMAGLEGLGAPRLLVLVAQFLYRYLFVVFEEAHRMRLAAALRGGLRGRLGFAGAAGMVGVLFGRSYARAEGVERAMLARGFDGRMPVLVHPALTAADWAFLVLGALALAGSRWI
jgi:cobalt/nickel transport system permease protein